MNNARLRRAAVVFAIVLCALAIVLRIAFSPYGVGLILRSQGFMLAGGRLHVGLNRFMATGLVISSLRGEPVLTADALDLHYDLRSIFSGKPHAYAITALRLDHPVFSMIRRADGSWNVPTPGGAHTDQAAPRGGAVLPAHVLFGLTIVDGSVNVRQPDLLDQSARTMTINHVTFVANVDTDRQSSYRLAGRILGRPLRAQGAIDAARGLAIHRVSITALPVATLLNAIIDSSAFVTRDGAVRDLTLTAYGNGRAGSAVLGDHVSLQADVAQFAASIAGLDQPVSNVHGHVIVTDDTVSFADAHGVIAGMPFTADGSIFAFAAPQLQITADGSSDLTNLRSLFSFSKALPITGTLGLHVAVEGRASSPTVVVNVSDGNLRYAGYPIAFESSNIVYQDGAVDLDPVAFRYGEAAFSAAGSIGVGNHARPMIALTASAPSASLPYLSGLFGGTTNAFVELGGEDTALEARAVFDGRDGERSLRGLAHLDRRGEGVIGPISLEQDGRTSLLAGAALVRPKGVFVGVIRANGARVSVSQGVLPGLALPPLPPLSGTASGGLALAGDYHTFLLNGALEARNINYAGRYGADVLSAVFGGDLRMLRISQADVQGPFGHLKAAGIAGSSGAALSGELQSRLDTLAGVFGQHGFAGTADLPFTLQWNGRAVAVNLANGQFVAASAFGIPIRAISGRAVIGPQAITLLARADVAGGEVLAGGDLTRGLAVSGSDLHLPGILHNADLDVAALVEGNGTQLRAHGTAMLENVRTNGLAINANAMFTADSQHVNLEGGILQTAGLVALLGGAIDDPSHGGVLDLSGRIVNASVATIAQHVVPQTASLYPTGSLDAALRIQGTFAAPRLEGTIEVPEGSISGLAFRDAHTRIEASQKLVRMRHGGVQVGGTAVRVGGAYDGQNFRSYVNAPQANLADFNDFFDQNNMLAGNGHVRITAATGASSVRTMADVDLRDVRVSSFVLGTTHAHWHSAGRDISGSLGIDGISGKLAVNGDLELPARAPAVEVLRRSRLNLSGFASGLDLARWLPALGIEAPVTGRLDIAGRASGSLPKLSADLSIQAHETTIGPVPIDEAQARLVASNGRGTLERAHVVVHGAVVDASGNFGFAPTDPLALAVHAQAPDIGGLAASLVQALRGARATRLGLSDTGTRAGSILAALQPLNGAAATSLSIGGSMMRPRFVGALDVEAAHIRGLSLPRALASFSLEGKKLNLTDAEIALQKGNVTIAGALPLVLAPFSIGPADASLSLDISANAVDLSSFTSLLPAKSNLQGVIDGAIALEGTPASPQLFGELDLSAASFVSPLESVPIRSAGSTLRLGGRSANLTASATVGGGVFALNGQASVANLTAIGYDTAYSLHASANRATVDLANYGRGTIDADVTVSHVNNGIPHVDGTIALSDAQVPFSAFYLPASGNTTNQNSLLSRTALNVRLIAGKNARVRSGSIDLGATGAATLAGTVGNPTLAGAFTSDGGNLTYFNRSFHVASGRVEFDPAEGIDPQLTAAATTTVNDPDTNAAYNTSGRVTITLNVSGSLDHLNVGLSSDPSYSRQQILGLLLNVPLLGAVHFNQSTGGAASAGNGLNLPNSNTNSGQVTVSQEAFSLVNAQFTQSLLAPISNALGGAVGLSDLAVDFDQTGGLDLSARRHIVGNVYAFFRDSIGVPTRQSLGVDFEPNDATAVSVSIFQEQGLTTLGRGSTSTLFTPQPNSPETSSSASGGSNHQRCII